MMNSEGWIACYKMQPFNCSQGSHIGFSILLFMPMFGKDHWVWIYVELPGWIRDENFHLSSYSAFREAVWRGRGRSYSALRWCAQTWASGACALKLCPYHLIAVWPWASSQSFCISVTIFARQESSLPMRLPWGRSTIISVKYGTS